MYTVSLSRQAEKSLAALLQSQPKMGQRVAAAIDRLAENPENGVPLRGELKGCWKYRVGSYRIIYQIVRKRLIVTIIDIGYRREVYR